MAYNVLKGVVEGSVDQYGDQEIDGIKVFKNTISASVFYDTDAQSPCATVNEVAFKRLEGKVPNGILTFRGDRLAGTNRGLTFDGTTLKTKHVRAERLFGSGEGLTNIPADAFAGRIAADNIKFGTGLHSVRGDLQIKTSKGVTTTNDGLTVAAAPAGGLSFVNSDLAVDPRNARNIGERGQNLSGDDVMLVHDTSRGEVRHTTLDNLFDAYINVKIPHPAGAENSLQLKAKRGFKASPALTFDVGAKLLNIQGHTLTHTLKVEQDLTLRGAVYTNVTRVSDEIYEVKQQDYTVIGDTTDNAVKVLLPPACNCRGRVINIKKTNRNTYKLKTHTLEVGVLEGKIDFKETIQLKYTYSFMAVQSDGENWWIIGRSGS